MLAPINFSFERLNMHIYKASNLGHLAWRRSFYRGILLDSKCIVRLELISFYLLLGLLFWLCKSGILRLRDENKLVDSLAKNGFCDHDEQTRKDFHRVLVPFEDDTFLCLHAFLCMNLYTSCAGCQLLVMMRKRRKRFDLLSF